MKNFILFLALTFGYILVSRAEKIQLDPRSYIWGCMDVIHMGAMREGKQPNAAFTQLAMESCTELFNMRVNPKAQRLRQNEKHLNRSTKK